MSRILLSALMIIYINTTFTTVTTLHNLPHFAKM